MTLIGYSVFSFGSELIMLNYTEFDSKINEIVYGASIQLNPKVNWLNLPSFFRVAIQYAKDNA